jgi:hypothetical protein
VQSGSFLTARSHRLNFYVVLRKLISKLQAFSQGIHKTSMVRPDSPIDPNDVVLTRQMSCDDVFHELPHTPPQSNEDRLSRQRSRRFTSKLVLVGNLLYLAQRHDS